MRRILFNRSPEPGETLLTSAPSVRLCHTGPIAQAAVLENSGRQPIAPERGDNLTFFVILSIEDSPRQPKLAILADLSHFTQEDDPKRIRVLDSAMKVVLAHGYQHTTMDDVARAAEMSRPALYLLFRNKADIYRAVASRMFNQTSCRVADVMSGDAPLGERLYRAIDEHMIEMVCEIHKSPHGAELLDLRNQLAKDIVQQWQGTLRNIFGGAIAAEAARLKVDLRERGLCPEILAELLLDGLEGMKMRTPSAEAQRLAARQLVRVIELAMQP